jgi:hypothetical protein
MITGHIFISTTWAASTSYIPYAISMQQAKNSTDFATTAQVLGVWEHQIYEEKFKEHVSSDPDRYLLHAGRLGSAQHMRASLGGLGSFDIAGKKGNAFYPGTIIETSIRKLKALRVTPNRSGIQVNKQLVKGNQLVFQYEALGELVRP